MKHRLTVVMTSYNIEEFLPRFFECFSKQTYTDFCLLVVDDGSTDNSVAVIKEYAEKDHNKYRFEDKKRKVKDKILYLAPKPLHSLNKKRIENKERRINNRIKKGC